MKGEREASLNLGGNLQFLESVKVRTGISQEAKSAAHLVASSENKEEIKFSSAEHVFLGFRFPSTFSPPLPVTGNDNWTLQRIGRRKTRICFSRRC